MSDLHMPPELDEQGRILVGGFSPQSGVHIISNGHFWCNGGKVPSNPTVYGKYSPESVNKYIKVGCDTCDKYLQEFAKK